MMNIMLKQPTMPTMRPRPLLLLLACLLASATWGATKTAAVPAGIVGKWLFKNEMTEIRFEARADGRYIRTERTMAGEATVNRTDVR